jgi:hypothetical protein
MTEEIAVTTAMLYKARIAAKDGGETAWPPKVRWSRDYQQPRRPSIADGEKPMVVHLDASIQKDTPPNIRLLTNHPINTSPGLYELTASNGFQGILMDGDPWGFVYQVVCLARLKDSGVVSISVDHHKLWFEHVLGNSEESRSAQYQLLERAVLRTGYPITPMSECRR